MWEKLVLDLAARGIKHGIAARRGAYLNYSPAHAVNTYMSARRIDKSIPYEELAPWLGKDRATTDRRVSQIELDIDESPFQLKWDGGALDRFRGRALDELTSKRFVTRNEMGVRVSACEFNEQEDRTLLTIQPSRYHEEAKSHHVLDWKGKHGLHKQAPTFRKYLLTKFGDVLPPLSTELLSNSLGIAVVVLVRDEDDWVPYMPLRPRSGLMRRFFARLTRSAQLAITFDGGFHCTASGHCEWPRHDHRIDFENSVKREMYKELEEEVGLQKGDVRELTPVALCREFVRAGKPQIFFMAYCELQQEDIREAFHHAFRRQRRERRQDPVEIHRRYITTREEVATRIRRFGLTLEAQANLWYADRYIQQFLRPGTKSG